MERSYGLKFGDKLMIIFEVLTVESFVSASKAGWRLNMPKSLMEIGNAETHSPGLKSAEDLKAPVKKPRPSGASTHVINFAFLLLTC